MRRSLPSQFPQTSLDEVMAGRLIRASVLRRMTQAQNYLWANLRKVYIGTGYEGFGAIAQNMPTAQPFPLGLEQLPDGTQGKCVCSFYVPRNWCAGSRVRIATRVTYVRVSGDARVVAVLCRLDDTPTGTWTFQSMGAAGTYDLVMRLRVPQDNDYQVKIYLQINAAASDTPLQNYAFMSNVSARYDQPDETDLFGQTFASQPQEWKKHTNVPADLEEWMPAFTHLYQRVVNNTKFLWHNRGPELCQSYLWEPWSRATAFTEVGRYNVAHVKHVNQWTGRVFAHVMGAGGAGCDVRLLVDGVVIQTWAGLAAGNHVLTLTGFNPGSVAGPIQERTITVEARHASAGATWGTIVWGVYVWESGVDESGLTILANYSPIDEDNLQGDSPLLQRNRDTQRAGIQWMLENDRWLYRNRLRTVVGDWRHRIYKRLVTYASASTVFDPRVDWTRGDQWGQQLLAPKNITLMRTAGVDDTDPISSNPNGAAGSSVGYNEVPFTYPTSMSFLQPGARLLFGYFGHANTGLASTPTAGWRLMARAKRARPAIMAQDQNGFGPLAEEGPYKDQGYLEIVYNGVTQSNLVRIRSTQAKQDHEHQWLNAARGTHTASSGATGFTIRGRLPPQPTGTPPAPRAEGMLFEVELASAHVADEPLTQDSLDALT